MIRIREKNCQIETGFDRELFCSFDIYWRNSKDDLLHPAERCIDVAVQEILNKPNNTSTPGRLYPDVTPRTLESFHGFLKDSVIQWCPNYRIFYRDDENDDIPIDSDLEYKEALKFLLSRNKKTKENVMMIIEGDIKMTNNKLGDEKTSMQLNTSMPNTSAIDSVTDDSKECSKLQKETASFHEMNSSDDTKHVASDSSKNEEAFNMLQTYLEHFKQEIVNDVVKIMEKKLLVAFGNVGNSDADSNQESPIHETLNQNNSQRDRRRMWDENVPRLRRFRDEMQRHNRPVIETRNIGPRSFPGQFPMFPIQGTPYRHSHAPPTLPPFPPPNAFAPFMDTSEFEKYISLLAQGAASAQLASDMFAKCNNNPRKDDTKAKAQKETSADNTETMEASEDINETPSDSSSFEILSAHSSPTHIDDDNSKLLHMNDRTVETYDCLSDEEHHETSGDPTFVVTSSDTAGKQQPIEKIVPELDKRSGGAYSYVNGTLLSTSSNGMTATDSLIGNNSYGKAPSDNTKPTNSPNVDKKQSSTNRHDSRHNRSSRWNSRMNDHMYTNISTDGRPSVNNGSSQNKRGEFMNSYHNLLHNERDYRREYSQPMTTPSQYPSAEEYWMRYDPSNYFPPSNAPHSGWIDPSMMNPAIRAFDAARKALSVAHEVMDKSSKTQGPRM